MSFNIIKKFWIWPFLLALTIFLASGSKPAGAPNVANIDKLFHFLIFGLIATTLVRTRRPVTWKWAIATIVIVSGYGIADEFRQSFTPGRSVEWQDWFADTLGAITSVLLYKCVPLYSTILEAKLPSKSRQSEGSKKNMDQ